MEAFVGYGPGLTVEVLQVVLYPGISVLFDHVDETMQVVITILFPLKISLKRLLSMLNRRIDGDQHGVVVVVAVEICASLYQSMIFQTTPSYAAMAFIMGLDAFHGLISIRYILDRPMPSVNVTNKTLMAEAAMILRSQRPQLASQVGSGWLPGQVVPLGSISTFTAGSSPASPKGVHCKQRSIVDEALHLAQAAETFVLLEYIEVIVPVINCLYLVVAAQLPSAFYNTRLVEFYTQRDRLGGAITSILLYSLLQAVSCAVMHYVLKIRYSISAVQLLGFVLEHHGNAIQAKMVAWFTLILHFTPIQYGTDFSFRFAFNETEQWNGPP